MKRTPSINGVDLKLVVDWSQGRRWVDLFGIVVRVVLRVALLFQLGQRLPKQNLKECVEMIFCIFYLQIEGQFQSITCKRQREKQELEPIINFTLPKIVLEMMNNLPKLAQILNRSLPRKKNPP